MQQGSQQMVAELEMLCARGRDLGNYLDIVAVLEVQGS